MGIGLAICKKIVENHNGYISAKGTEGVGAQFIVYLPA
ncbi:ATP-binding protein [Mariniflexile sp. AS56]|nr:ATP-binding protein [Mariniflexile sp. AS56]MDO7172325.1 ATP-binding protein [Mariniflexile sp. AS56]